LQACVVIQDHPVFDISVLTCAVLNSGSPAGLNRAALALRRRLFPRGGETRTTASKYNLYRMSDLRRNLMQPFVHHHHHQAVVREDNSKTTNRPSAQLQSYASKKQQQVWPSAAPKVLPILLSNVPFLCTAKHHTDGKVTGPAFAKRVDSSNNNICTV